MDYKTFMAIIEPVLGYPLNEEQEGVVTHETGPLWVVAGPGSGKTEVLVLRTLKLIFVNEINPKSIIITTFTKKAAKNIFDRILVYSDYIFKSQPELKEQIDLHSLRIGTLHGLCNDIMLEYKTSLYENYRLLDDYEQYLQVYEHSDLVKDSRKHNTYLSIWNKFNFLFPDGWDGTYLPNKWLRAEATISIFNRIVEDLVDIEKMKIEDKDWFLLAEAYEHYTEQLEYHHRCDFAHLQQKFIYFLNSELGKLFLNGNGTTIHPGIQQIMVDEYQDTNLIQEEIYFLLSRNNHNLCVVGDDDQALYRFRGGTVDCMVNFDSACNSYLGLPNSKLKKIFLNTNYRSHEKIIAYYNEYINSFDCMKVKGARVDSKPALKCGRRIESDYPSVAYITGKNKDEVALHFTNFVRYLKDNSIISDYSQCVLLMRSAKENSTYAGSFANELRKAGINPYNPRSRKLLDQEEIKLLLGSLVSIIDPDLEILNTIWGEDLRHLVESWFDEYQRNEINYPNLAEYISKSKNYIKYIEKDKWLNVSLLDIFYRLLSHEPFVNWTIEPEKSYRLGKISTILEAYSSIPYSGSIHNTRGNLKTSKENPGKISSQWVMSFYYSLIGLLEFKGLNDPEDDSIICPPGKLPIMTVHQAKGLEFPFVFFYGLRESPSNSSVLLEDLLSTFSSNTLKQSFSTGERIKQDLIRFYYVAYSRPEYALIHLVTSSQFKDGYGFPNQQGKLFKSTMTRLVGDI